MTANSLYKWTAVFDMDNTLIDFEPIYSLLVYFFPSMYFRTQENSQKFKEFEGLLREVWISFSDELVKRDVRLIESGNTAGCLLRPGIESHLYELARAPGCQGMMILSNNRNAKLLSLANAMIYNISMRNRVILRNSVTGKFPPPPFSPYFLIHHGHPARSDEHTAQRIMFPTYGMRDGILYNNTTKTLSTVKRVYEERGNHAFASLLGTPSRPYSLLTSENKAYSAQTPEQLIKTDRILFVDDLSHEKPGYAHQLEYELENPALQFIHCSPYKTQTTTADLMPYFWNAWIQGAKVYNSKLLMGGNTSGLKDIDRLYRYFLWLGQLDYGKPATNTAFYSVNMSHPILKKKNSTPEEEFQAIKLFVQQNLNLDESNIGSVEEYGEYNDPVDWEDRIDAFLTYVKGKGMEGGRRKKIRHTVRRKHKKNTRRLRKRGSPL